MLQYIFSFSSYLNPSGHKSPSSETGCLDDYQSDVLRCYWDLKIHLSCAQFELRYGMGRDI